VKTAFDFQALPNLSSLQTIQLKSITLSERFRAESSAPEIPQDLKLCDSCVVHSHVGENRDPGPLPCEAKERTPVSRSFMPAAKCPKKERSCFDSSKSMTEFAIYLYMKTAVGKR